MKKGFTLIELLVVIGIMGLLGTASVGGYRQMRRGMEEKGVLQNVNTLVRAAYQRAQIDRQPTAVVFWNETLRSDSDDADESAIVVGRAVAVRRYGRITRVVGQTLLDEFADLEHTYPTNSVIGGGSSSKAGMYLYPMEDLSSSEIRRSLVDTKVKAEKTTPRFLTGDKLEQMASSASGEGDGSITIYGFRLLPGGDDVNWEIGTAYGFEFANIELPHGYIFGKTYKSSSGSPVQHVGTLFFDVGYNDGNGMDTSGSSDTVEISALRPESRSGELKPTTIGRTAKPNKN